jgi:CRP-like cAMP-binding protein
MFEGIPDREYEKFHNFIQVYNQGAQIVVEDIQDDKGLFLLRKGEVGIYKKCGEGRELLSRIKAINFFGEMSIIVGGPRTATVEVLSKNAVVYAFRTPDLDIVLSNSKWGIMLVSRLSQNLKESNVQIINLRQQNNQIREQNEHLTQGVVEIFNITEEIQRNIAQDAVATAREWKYLTSIIELEQCLLKSRLPEIASQIGHVDPSVWKDLYKEGNCPEIIYDYMKEAIKKRPPRA